MSESVPPDATSEDAAEKGYVQIRLVWPLGTGGPTVYANQFALTQTGELEYVLEFGELLITGFSNRTKEEVVEALKAIEIKPVARIAVSKVSLAALANMLKGHATE